MPGFHYYNYDDIKVLISGRASEVKLGEHVACVEDSFGDILAQSAAKFVIVGAPEDIGVRANLGLGGAHTAWPAFLKSFLNIQENEFLSGKDFFIAGHLEVAPVKGTIEELRKETELVDHQLAPVIEMIVAAGKIPIVIGGGHNNAYPILMACAQAKKISINAINLDPHADFRLPEGRHSGNGFRYAYEEKFLSRYAMLGLHEAYNSRVILEELNANGDLSFILWEDIFLRRKLDWEEAVQQALAHVKNELFGVELDLDAIEMVLSSAMTPVGISSQQAMRYLYQCGREPHSIYLHLPEGVAEREDGLGYSPVGKLLSYLVQAFVKGVQER